MNEQYSDSWLRGGLRNSDHTEDPITGSVWIRRHRHRDRTNSQRDRDSLRETNTIKSFFYQGVSSQSKRAKSTEFILNKSPFKNQGVTHILADKGNIIPDFSPPLPLHHPHSASHWTLCLGACLLNKVHCLVSVSFLSKLDYKVLGDRWLLFPWSNHLFIPSVRPPSQALKHMLIKHLAKGAPQKYKANVLQELSSG